MRIETRNQLFQSIESAQATEAEVMRALSIALHTVEHELLAVRVRVEPAGTHETTCRARVWRRRGSTLCVEKTAGTANEAINAVAVTLCDVTRRAVGRRRATRRHSRSLTH